MTDIRELLDEISDVLPPPEEILSEITLSQSTWTTMTLAQSTLDQMPGFFGVPVFIDNTMAPGEIHLRFADGHVKILTP